MTSVRRAMESTRGISERRVEQGSIRARVDREQDGGDVALLVEEAAQRLERGMNREAEDVVEERADGDAHGAAVALEELEVDRLADLHVEDLRELAAHRDAVRAAPRTGAWATARRSAATVRRRVRRGRRRGSGESSARADARPSAAPRRRRRPAGGRARSSRRRASAAVNVTSMSSRCARSKTSSNSVSIASSPKRPVMMTPVASAIAKQESAVRSGRRTSSRTTMRPATPTSRGRPRRSSSGLR